MQHSTVHTCSTQRGGNNKEIHSILSFMGVSYVYGLLQLGNNTIDATRSVHATVQLVRILLYSSNMHLLYDIRKIAVVL